MKILILKPSSLGDVVHALPVLRLLRLHWPRAEVYWWLEAGLVPLLEGDPDLAGIFPFERQRWAAPWHWPEMWAGIRALRRQRFDLAIDLQGLARSALFAWLANADLTVGLDNPGEGGREGARALYDLTPPRCRPGTHAVERYWAVLALLGVPVHRDFQWLPPRPLVAERVRAQVGHWIDRCVVVLPGARWENKRWPAEYFRELVERMLTTTRDLCFKVLGSAADRALAQVITQACPERVQDLTGQTSLPEMVEWIRLSRLVISNDTGPLHVAAALGRPVVAIFGPTDAATTGPYQQRSDVLQNNGLSCVPCLKDRCTNSKPLECLRSLTPARVCEAACQRLAGAT